MTRISKHIISLIAQKTGIPEIDIEAVLSEFTGFHQEMQLNTLHSGQEVYSVDKLPGSAKKYSGMSRSRVIDELRKRRGSAEILDRFLKLSKMPKKILAEHVLEINPKTLNVYCNADKELPIRITEQILKLETMYEKGIELFEDAGTFNKWLRSDSYGLGNMKPLELINSITGIELVYEELIRIEFGATA